MCDSCLQIFSHKSLFWVWPQKKEKRSSCVVSVCFCKRWVPCFQIKQRWVPFVLGFSGIVPRFSGIFPGFSRILLRFSRILPGFSGIFPIFLTSPKFWGFACTPLHPHLLHHCVKPLPNIATYNSV